MLDVTLTDAAVDAIEARATLALDVDVNELMDGTFEVGRGPMQAIQAAVADVPALAKALRESRAALREIALPCHDYDCDERPAIARAALGEERP